MNLFKAELRRIARRRLTLVFGILLLAGVVGLAVILASISSKGPSEETLAEAQAQADEMNEQNPDYLDCVEDESYFEDNEMYGWVETDPEYEGMSHKEACEHAVGGWWAEDFIWTYTFDFENEGPFVIVGVMIVAGLVMMLLGSSAIGAEWSSGGMSNLMVWHPNRMRLWGVKLGAALAACAAGVVVLAALAFGLLVLVASLRGEVGVLDGVWWEDTLELVLRTGVLALGMTLLGASLAMLGRHTAIAGGVIAGYLIVGELIVNMVSMNLSMDFPERLSLYTWVGAWITGRVELYGAYSGFNDMTPEVMVITWGDAGVLLGAIVLLFGALATWSFQRRDAA
ncbi:ABC transporter permease subunit [Glycomyces dulcitolivorans]|uniref:ABC transporter permease subunit n=1 Tax=Glycomyces dulcitolivorans TaxID=2200759 RepID=UPI000DD33938|nr:ABC transporter permease subunit [Glycomyces dulcitolivorans]